MRPTQSAPIAAYVYVRHEYPLAVRRMRHAIDRMQAEGLLGNAISGSRFSLDVEIVEGAGAFVCGEETALLQSIMGRRGTPQLRPPYPVERGLFDQPTLVNNVETFANVPWIIRHGPERFAAMGTETSNGTKVFSLAGKVRRGGLIEIPMGLTIREVVEKIGGGVGDGKRFKAVQIGGPSGGCVPAELADTPIDYEHLREVGAIVGSGGMVVLDDDDCMVDVARYFLEFTQRESCGHCTFCRVGTRKLLDILERICAGKGQTARPGRDRSALPVGHAGQPVRAGQDGAQSGPLNAEVFSRRVRSTLAGTLPGRSLQIADSLPRHPRLRGLHLVRPAVSGRSHSAHALSPARDRRGPMHSLRCVPCGLSRTCNQGRLMVRLWIDHTSVEVAEGTSILAAARQLGIDIPALCHEEGQAPHNSCMCCLVRVDDGAGVVPSCATPVQEGMQVESETRRDSRAAADGHRVVAGRPCGRLSCAVRKHVPGADGRARICFATWPRETTGRRSKR